MLETMVYLEHNKGSKEMRRDERHFLIMLPEVHQPSLDSGIEAMQKADGFCEFGESKWAFCVRIGAEEQPDDYTPYI